jgi:hypothetical protein
VDRNFGGYNLGGDHPNFTNKKVDLLPPGGSSYSEKYSDQGTLNRTI